MSADITIQEGGKDRRFVVGSLTIDLQDDEGTSKWVPASDVALKNLYESENGIFVAKAEGCYGFETVTINVPALIQGYDPDDEEYKIITFDPDTLEPIEVVTPDDFPNLDENDWLIGIDPETGLPELIVDTGELETLELPEEFPIPDFEVDLEDLEIEIPELEEPELPEVEDEIADALEELGLDDTEIDDFISDLDLSEPTTSLPGVLDNTDTLISVDDNGFLVEESLPAYIQIATRPTHEQSGFAYIDGESINASGLTVTIHNADGSLWEHPDYPFSVISYSDTQLKGMDGIGIATGGLIIDPTIASLDKVSEEGTYINGQGIVAREISYDVHQELHYTAYCVPYVVIDDFCSATLGSIDNAPATLGGHDYGSASLLVTKYDGKLYAIRIGGDNPYFELYKYNEQHFDEKIVCWHFSGGTNYRTKTEEWTMGVWEEHITNIPISSVMPTGDGSDMVSIGGTQTITVIWPRYGDGMELTATFEVEVEPDGFTGHDGTF